MVGERTRVRFRFGEFELDEARFELRRGGERVPVQPKVFRLLSFLLERRARVVSRKELLDGLWPGETVTFASVKRAVRGARLALGEGADSESAIRTVVGEGYRFVLPVEVADDTASVPPPPPASARTDNPFVGRSSVLEFLRGVLDDVVGGRGRVVLLSGEAGIGKTRTAEELLRSASERGALVLAGHCVEVEGAPAFWPLLEMLRQCVDSRGAADVALAMGSGVSEIVAALPELRPHFEPITEPPRIDGVQARFRFYDALGRFFVRLAAKVPLVLFVDDLHRSDQSTLLFLTWLARQVRDARVCVVGTARSPDAATAPEVLRLLGELERLEATRAVRLEGIGMEDVSRYFALSLGRDVPPDVAHALTEMTAGNPLFCRGLLQASRARESAFDWEWIGEAAKSPGLRSAIELWVGRLAPASRRVLQLASVVGREFSVGLLLHVSGEVGAELVGAVSDGVSAGVLRGDPKREGLYRFVHVLVRDALYLGLTEAERIDAHGKVAAAMHSLHDGVVDEVAVDLAHHYALAAPAIGAAQAVARLRWAAHLEARRMAYESAVTLLDRALEVQEMAPADPAERLELLLAKGESLAAAGQVAKARAALLQAVAVARDVGSVDALFRAAVALSKPMESGRLDHDRIELLRDVEAALPSGDPRRPLVTALLAKSLLFLGDVPARTDIAREAVRTARALNDLELLGEVLQHAHLALSEPEHHIERRALGTELVSVARRTDDPALFFQAHRTQLQDLLESGNLSAVGPVVDSIGVLAEQTREPSFRHHHAVFRAMMAIAEGRLAEAEVLSEQAFELGRVLCEETAEHIWITQRCTVFLLQFRLSKVMKLTREASVRYPRLTSWQAVFASVQALVDNKAFAVAELDRLMRAGLEDAERDPFVLSTLAPLAELAYRVGSERHARTLYAALEPHAALNVNVLFGVNVSGPVSRFLGMLATTLRDHAAAQRHFEAALDACRRGPMPAFESVTAFEYASMLAASNPKDRRRIQSLLDHAIRLGEPRAMNGVVRAATALKGALALPAASITAQTGS